MNRATALTLFLLCCQPILSAVSQAAPPRYNRDIRPILAENCFRCHGPDAAGRQAELRLDEFADATRHRSGLQAINPGNVERSELIRRITSADPDVRMPPPEAGERVSPQQIAVLRDWIAAGAEYEAHWSFVPPNRPNLPTVRAGHWSKNSVDRFVLARLESEGRQPSMQADAAALARRMTLSVTGLPPTLAELDEFEAAFARNEDQACSELITRLFQSPRYGEHMATDWLDAARYADTNGYFTDDERTMWPWRDWVINAFNRNMPFDQFTIEQLAGDLLPDASVEQQIATGFNRNHMVNNETGIIEEEFRIEYVVDRVDTTATVWMGLTMGCAKCHDHKYDPISQKDFYRFFGLFNNVPEKGLSGSGGNSAPTIRVPAPELQAELQKFQQQTADLQKQLAVEEAQLAAQQTAWEQDIVPTTFAAAYDYPLEAVDQHTAIDGTVSFAKGFHGNAARFDGDGAIELHQPDLTLSSDRPFSFAAWINPQSAGCIVSKTDDVSEMRGFDVTLRKGKAIVNLVHRWKRDAIQVITSGSIPMRSWHFLTVSWDGSGTADGVKIYLDGEQLPTHTAQDNLSGTIQNDQPVRLGRRSSSASLKGRIDEVQFFRHELSGVDVNRLFGNNLIRSVVSKPDKARSNEESLLLKVWFARHHGDLEFSRLRAELTSLQSKQRRLAKLLPTSMVMQEMSQTRPVRILERGQYDAPGEEVSADFPFFLTTPVPFGEQAVANRLHLAKWLLDPKHPLTARVTVNRLWQQIFGTGIVASSDDFGTQGEWPSHPELLDWLAVEFVESGWDFQHMLRLMLTSATFRQSSNAALKHYNDDPDNRLLARGPRFRMNAEVLRDQALFVSGLLINKVGGASVRPYQPTGLWKEVSYDGDDAYIAGQGDSVYRRSLYTFRKRQIPPPNLLLFDAPTRETCVVRRSRTNTPLQALVLMNDPTYIEAARCLAERMLTEVSGDDSTRIAFAFRLVTARRPTAEEIKILQRIYDAESAEFRSNRPAVEQLLLVGRAPVKKSADRVKLAAWTAVASVILTLDESLTLR